MLINLSELFSSDGKEKTYTQDIEMTEFHALDSVYEVVSKEPVRVPVSFEIAQELDLNQTDEERLDALDEQPYISGYCVDVDRLVGNELLLNLPMKVLCRDDCDEPDKMQQMWRSDNAAQSM